MVKIVRRAKATQEQLAHITQEMYKQNLELAERNKTLTLLRRIDEVVLSGAGDEEEVTQMVAKALIHDTDFNFAAIYVADRHKTVVNAGGWAYQSNLAAQLQEMLKSELSTISLRSRHNSVFSYAVSARKTQLVSTFSTFKSTITDSQSDKLKDALGLQTLFICPLQTGTGLIGVLVLGVPVKKEDISSFVRNLVERLTTTISIAVENHLLYEELQEVSARLRVQNKRLKELDKTKDEFISMASHQLRTPLTAVKGYLSMVLEGDVGKVTKAEKEYIKKAFDGANKMVYLIGDMLNVSRLQTGKFVIDSQPVDLDKLIEGEISQLQEEITGHRLKLSYHKPEETPILKLDETKTRQVVMNFLDNAIHYTPADGSITVELSASEEEVRFTVTDTGMGVPAAVQHHLFSKFYRANNARKMRPDGTGLGLFMAKKVIAAQGGAIIFKSTEGKGSTFGFSFPRHATEVKAPVAVSKT